MIRRLIKAIFVLAVLGAIGFIGYAYFADLTPEAQDIRLPVTLNGQ
jgi:hypothetical protein